MAQGNWITEDGLRLERCGPVYNVHIVRELPDRLGSPADVDLPKPGTKILKGQFLLAAELTKARVEFWAPADLEVVDATLSKHKKPSFTLRVKILS